MSKQKNFKWLDLESRLSDVSGAGTVVVSSSGGGGGGTTSNADTVDGFHASSIPTALKLLALNGSAQYPISVIDWASVDHNALANLTIGNPHTQYINAAGDGLQLSGQTISVNPSIAGSGLTYSSGILNVGAGAGITVNDDNVALTEPGTLYYNSRNSSAGNHTHAITSTTDASVYPDHLLRSDDNGDLKLHRLDLTDRLRASLIDSQSGSSLTLQPALDLILSPGSPLVKLTNNVSIQSDGYASQTTGWRITYNGQGDFRYLYSDELHVKAFITDLEQALAGGQIICKSVAELAADFTLPDAGYSADFYVKDLPGADDIPVFQFGDIVRFRQFTRGSGSLTVANAWGTVSNYVDQSDGTQKWTFTRSNSPNQGSASGTISAKTLVLDYGTAGNGFYEVNAIDGLWAANSPYAQIATWSTHPAADTVTRARFGNLKGLFGIANEYGLYAGDGTATANKYLRLSNRFLEGHNLPIHLYDGSTQVIKLEPGTNPYMAVGNPAPSGYLSASGIWAGRDSDTLYKMHVGTISGGDIAKGWKWDGSNLIVKGDVYITNGDIAGTPASYVHGWQYGSTTYINGGAIQAYTVTADKVFVSGQNLLGNGGFERGTVGWVFYNCGAIDSAPNTQVHSGTYSLCGIGNGTSRYIATTPGIGLSGIPVDNGATYYLEGWVTTTSGAGAIGFLVHWYTAAGNWITDSQVYVIPAANTWSRISTFVTAPNTAAFCAVTCWLGAGIAVGQYGYYDDIVLRRASQNLLLVGTPGSARVEINNNGIEGYNSSNTKQFYLQTADGKGYFGGGKDVLDSTGLILSGTETTYATYNGIRWLDGSSEVARAAAGKFALLDAGGYGPYLRILVNSAAMFYGCKADFLAYAASSDYVGMWLDASATNQASDVATFGIMRSGTFKAGITVYGSQLDTYYVQVTSHLGVTGTIDADGFFKYAGTNTVPKSSTVTVMTGVPNGIYLFVAYCAGDLDRYSVNWLRVSWGNGFVAVTEFAGTFVPSFSGNNLRITNNDSTYDLACTWTLTKFG